MRQRFPHLDGRPDGTQRIVLVQFRKPEHRHHGIADELRERATMPLDDRLHALEIVRKDVVKRFRINPLAQSGRVDNVREENGDLSTKLLRGLLLETLATGVAEAGFVSVAFAAELAGDHGAESMSVAAWPHGWSRVTFHERPLR
jgi:hypothetical protein